MKPNTIAVIKFLKANHGVDFTAADVAQALSLDVRTVNGIFTGAISNKGLGVRVASEVLGADDKTVVVKYLKLTDAGLAVELA